MQFERWWYTLLLSKGRQRGGGGSLAGFIFFPESGRLTVACRSRWRGAAGLHKAALVFDVRKGLRYSKDTKIVDMGLGDR